MTYTSIDRDQQQRLEQDLCIEEIYISGIGDAMDAVFPQMAEINYLMGYAEGMRQLRARIRTEVMLPVINTTTKEYPLSCGQCTHLINGKCAIKGVTRNSSNYACDRASIDCVF